MKIWFPRWVRQISIVLTRARSWFIFQHAEDNLLSINKHQYLGRLDREIERE
jgi:hypothetical protein